MTRNSQISTAEETSFLTAQNGVRLIGANTGTKVIVEIVIAIAFLKTWVTHNSWQGWIDNNDKTTVKKKKKKQGLMPL